MLNVLKLACWPEMGPIDFGTCYVIYTNNKKGLVWNRTPWFLEAFLMYYILANYLQIILYSRKSIGISAKEYYPVFIQTDMEISNSACIS